MPLQGTRAEGNDQFWGSGRDAIAGCRCRVTPNFGGVDVVPLLGANSGAIVVMVGGIFFFYIDNTKMGFWYLGSI